MFYWFSVGNKNLNLIKLSTRVYKQNYIAYFKGKRFLIVNIFFKSFFLLFFCLASRNWGCLSTEDFKGSQNGTFRKIFYTAVHPFYALQHNTVTHQSVTLYNCNTKSVTHVTVWHQLRVSGIYHQLKLTGWRIWKVGLQYISSTGDYRLQLLQCQVNVSIFTFFYQLVR